MTSPEPGKPLSETELKPCPFCGGSNIRLAVGVGCRDNDCAAQGPMFSDKDIGLDKWNNAYCWKTIDENLREMTFLKEELNGLALKLADKNIELTHQAAQIRAYGKAFEEINRQCEFIKNHAHEGDKVICNVGQIQKIVALSKQFPLSGSEEGGEESK